MAQEIINTGAVPNDGTGDPLRTAFIKTDDNFDQIWAAGPVGSNVQISNNIIRTTTVNTDLVFTPSGAANVRLNNNTIPGANNIWYLGSATNRWRGIYVSSVDAGNITVSGSLEVPGDLTVGGNLTVEGDTIQVGNIVTDTKTIQLANTASTANAANGSGITVGINDSTATLLYSASGNVWTTNIGANVTGNVTADYFIGNGAMLTGIASEYGNANVADYLPTYLPTYSGNIGAAFADFTGNITVGNRISIGPGNGNIEIIDDSPFNGPIIKTPGGSGLDLLIEPSGNLLLSPDGGEVIIEKQTPSTDSNTGALLVYGGIGADGNINISGNVSAAGWTGNIIPSANAVYSLGNSTNYWSNLWVANNTIYIGGVPLGITAGNVLTVDGEPVGNVDADLPTYGGNILVDYLIGNTTDNSGYLQWEGNSSGDNNGYTTLRLVPDDTLVSNDQYLIIDPTEPQHIHIRAGGNIDASSASLYLGGELNYVRVVDDTGVRLQNRTRNNTFYNFVDPTDFNTATWYESAGTYFVQYTAVNAEIGDLAFTIGDDDENNVTVYYGGGSSQTLTYGSTSSNLGGGVYRFSVVEAPPASPTVLTAMDFEIWTNQTNSVVLSSNDFSVTVTDDIRIEAADTFSLRNISRTEPISIRTDYDNSNYGWEFGANGTLTTPGDIVVAGDVTGTAGANTLVLKAQPASNTAIQLNNSVDSVISTVANLEIRTDVSNTAKTWTFGTDGNLNYPDGTTSTGGAVYAAANASVAMISNNEHNQVRVEDDYVEIFTSLNGIVLKTWQFGNTGALTVPGNISFSGDPSAAPSLNDFFSVTSAVGFDVVANTSGTSQIFEFGADGDLTVPGNISATRLQNDGNLEIRSNVAGTLKNWTFDTLGDLNLPAGGNIGGSGGISANNITLTGSVNTAGNVNFTSAEATDTARIFADVAGLTTSLVLEVGDDDADAVVLRHYSFAAGNTIDMLRAQRSSNTEATVTVTGNFTATGNITGNTAGFAIGYRDIPQVSFTGNVTVAAADAGKHFYSTESTDYILTIANNASQGFAVGAAITIVNQGSGNITIAQGSGVTLYLAGNASSGNRSVATFGMATIMKVATDTWFINGTGVS